MRRALAALGAALAVLAAANVCTPSLPQAASSAVAKQEAVQLDALTRTSGRQAREVPDYRRAYLWATTQAGRPYIWAATGPYGYDCSGLVYAAYRRLGIYFGRDTYEMLASGRLVPVPASQIRQGYLAFYGTGHVELVSGPHSTFGAQEPGTLVGWHHIGQGWAPTMYFRVRGAGG